MRIYEDTLKLKLMAHDSVPAVDTIQLTIRYLLIILSLPYHIHDSNKFLPCTFMLFRFLIQY